MKSSHHVGVNVPLAYGKYATNITKHTPRKIPSSHLPVFGKRRVISRNSTVMDSIRNGVVAK